MNLILRFTLKEMFENENTLWRLLHSILNEVSNLDDDKKINFYKNLQGLLVSKEVQTNLIKEVDLSFYLLFP
jgi:hypothetical protein